MSEDKIEVWRSNAKCTEPIPTTLLQAQLLDASNIVEELQLTATRRLGLLERLIEHEGMIVFVAPRCYCGDCDLVREIEKEVKDG